jgi:hypothetical protein
MRALSAREMLAVWERGLDQSPLERALTLLEAACPESEPRALAAMSIGRRDARLLTLREWAFGARMTGCSVCRHCGQPLEIDMQVSDLRQNENDSEPGAIAVAVSGYELSLRPVNSLDLAACLDANADETTRQLFHRCLVEVRAGDQAASPEQVPDEVVQMAMESIAKADPQADLEIVMACASCGKNTSEVFDVVSFFWNEIDSWARRILREIHVLASSYGWRESEILALSPLRRQFYLDMAGA